MFKWLSSRVRTQQPGASVPRDPVADALLNVATLGRLPGDLLEGGAPPEPAPEYVQEATQPSAEAWEHERDARSKQEEDAS